MADNTSRITKIGPHLIIVDDGVFVTKFGAYAEILGEDVRVTSSGGTAEIQGGAARVTSSGAIAEILYSPGSPMATYKSSRTGNRAYHTTLPDGPTGYAFDPKWSWWSVIRGKRSKNEIINGSFEKSDVHLVSFAGWSAHGRNNSDDPGAAFGQYTYKGEAPATTLCEWTYDHDTGTGVLCSTLGPYTFSFWVYSAVDDYTFGINAIEHFSSDLLVNTTWRLSAGWQRLEISWNNISAANRVKFRMFCSAVNPSANTIYIDGLQLEQLRYATTYFDGDMIGWDDKHPDSSYFWEGDPHASASWRLQTTNSGGEIVSLSEEVGFLTTAILGLGMHPVDLKTITMDSGHEILVDSRSEPREFTIAGRIYGCDWSKLSQRRNEIIKLLNPQRNAKREPIILRYQPTNADGRPYGIPLDIKCAYKEGLGGNYTTLYQENIPIQMRASEPSLYEEITMREATDGYTVLVDNSVIWRDKDYLYQNLGNGTSTAGIWDVHWVQDTTFGRYPVVGGDFTRICGIAAPSYAAVWDTVSNVWKEVVSGDNLNAEVRAVSGNPFVAAFAGDFTASLAPVTLRKVAFWQPSAPLVWQEMAVGLSGGDAYCLSYKEGSNGCYVGGDFTNNGPGTDADVLNIAYVADATSSGTPWIPLRGGTNGLVRDILDLEDGNVIVVGDFTSVYTASGAASPQAANHIAHWDENDTASGQWGTKFWTGGVEKGFDDDVHSIVIGDDNMIYVGGIFTQDDTASYDLRGFARWNGSAWEEMLPLTDYMETPAVAHEIRLRKDANGVIWIITSDDNGFTVPQIGLCWMFGWKDGVIYPPPYKHEDYTGITNGHRCLRFTPHNEMFLGSNDSDGNDMWVPEQIEIEYNGTFETPVSIWARGECEPSFVEFPTIGIGGVYFAERGETVIASYNEVMQIRPDEPRNRVYSNTRALLNHLNLPATTMSKMKLLPNETNIVSVFFPETDISFQAHLWWHNRYSSIDPGAL
jgi:hypothetical protein